LREYETTFIVQPEISDEGCQDLLARIDGILEREGATKLLHEDQGKRKLAYEIRKFQKGRYITTYFLDEGKAVAPLERTLRLEESVLRFLTVQVTERVEDIEARKQAAAEEERIRAERARERAAREAEEEKARQEAARLAGEHYAEQDSEAGNLDDDDDEEVDDDEDADEDVGDVEEEDEDEEMSDDEDSDDSELENGGER
jgi:small subunit ribosomal protein S6